VEFNLSPGGVLNGELRVPGDKSISHRSVMLGALADGVSEVSGFLQGDDALATVAAFRALGVTIDGPKGGELRVHGAGLQGLRAPVPRWTWAIPGPACASSPVSSPGRYSTVRWWVTRP
jgi:3-phosphoshikimate 1-carboxyvinyltransferase